MDIVGPLVVLFMFASVWLVGLRIIYRWFEAKKEVAKYLATGLIERGIDIHQTPDPGGMASPQDVHLLSRERVADHDRSAHSHRVHDAQDVFSQARE